MTRKHFEEIALHLYNLRPIALSDAGKAQLCQWRAHVEVMAAFCTLQNTRFDRDRFMEACGYEEK